MIGSGATLVKEELFVKYVECIRAYKLMFVRSFFVFFEKNKVVLYVPIQCDIMVVSKKELSTRCGVFLLL